MKRSLAFVAVLAAAVSANAAAITTEVVQVEAGSTTNALIFAGEYDVYNVIATNPNDAPATSLQLSVEIPGKLDAGSTTFGAGADNPIVFGFPAPDTFFVLPVGTDPLDVLGVDVVDDASSLSASFTVAGGAELIPANGSAPILTISLPAGTPLDLPLELGRAAVAGEFVTVGIPEPTTAVLAGLALVGFVARRK